MVKEENPEGVESMCKAFEDTRNEGFVKGAMQRSIDIALDLIRANLASLEEIARITRLPLEKVRELAEKKSA